jgi:hypothetical protein
MNSVSYGMGKDVRVVGFINFIISSIVPYSCRLLKDMLCVGGLWVVTSDVSYVFLVSLFHVGWFGLYRCVDMFYVLVYRFRSCCIPGFYCFVLF